MQLGLTLHGNYLFAYNGVLEALMVVNISLRTLLKRRLADASPRLKSWVIDDYLLQKNPPRIILRDGCSTYQTEVDGCSIAPQLVRFASVVVEIVRPQCPESGLL